MTDTTTGTFTEAPSTDVKFAKIDTAASGQSTLVAAVPGKKIRILNFHAIAAGTVAVTLRSGTTAMTGAYPLIAGAVLAPNGSGFGVMETTIGEALNIHLSAAVQVSGALAYAEVPLENGSVITNTILPSFLQPDGDGGWEPADPVANNNDVFLDAGTWVGGVAPYTFDFAIYDAADDSVIVARGGSDEIDLGDLTGVTIYGRVWCTDSADPANEAYADTLPFGPIEAPSFVPQVLVSLNFRASAPSAPADEPVSPATYVLGSDVYTGSAIRGGQVFGATVGTPSGGNRTSSSDARLRGFMSFTSGTSRWRVDLPDGYTGPVKIRLASGTITAAGNTRLELFDGDPASSGERLLALEGVSHEAGEVVDAAGISKALATWISEGGGTAVLKTMHNSSIFIRRASEGSGSGGYICHLYVETAEAPE